MNRQCKFYIKGEQCEEVIHSKNLLRKKDVEKYINDFNFLMNKSKSEERNMDECLGFLRLINETPFDALTDQVDYGIIWNTTDEVSAAHVFRAGLHEFHATINKLEKRSTTKLREVEEISKIIVKLEKNDTSSSLEYQRLLDKIRNWSESLETELDTYIYTTQTIINAVYLTKIGVTHPALFSQKKIKTAVEYFVAKNQPSSMTFPISIDELHINKLLKISKSKVGFHGGKLLVILSVPLVVCPVYHLFKMHLYPTFHVFSHKQGSAYIQPKADYLLRTEDFYILPHAEDLVSCQNTDGHHYICSANFPLYSTQAQPICEATNIMTDNQQPFHNCNIELSSTFNSYWKKTGRGWLY
uniref:MYSP protein n=1 Tax=Fopius arisanus TaxID=64838 RepID=A0A0C9R8D6_9HYME